MRYRTKKKKRFIIPASIVVALLVIGATVFLATRWRDEPQNTSTVEQGEINFDPPTEEDKQEVERNKQELADKQDNPAQPPQIQDGRTVREPVITYAQQSGDNIEVTGYTPGVFEDGGTCKFTFAKGNLSIVKESAGFADVNRTSCTPLIVPVSEFPQKGIWAVTIGYSSQTSTGTSTSKDIKVQ